MIRRLKTEKRVFISIAPYVGTWSNYTPLYESQAQNIDVINYQVYADQPARKDLYMQRYAELAGVAGGYGKLALGIESSKHGGRGIAQQEAFDALIDLRGLGLRGLFVWALEFSQRDWNYELERTFQGILHA